APGLCGNGHERRARGCARCEPDTGPSLMRRAVAAAALMLLAAGCSPESTAPAADPKSMIECAIDSTVFERACAIEHVSGGEIPVLIARHPDGGFRRFEILADGRGVATADGADVAQV